jgi:hypothetical protein
MITLLNKKNKKGKQDISKIESEQLDSLKVELLELTSQSSEFKSFGEVLSIKSSTPVTDNINQLLDVKTEQTRELFSGYL